MALTKREKALINDLMNIHEIQSSSIFKSDMSDCEKVQALQAINSMLETVLHTKGIYSGFKYLDPAFVEYLINYPASTPYDRDIYIMPENYYIQYYR